LVEEVRAIMGQLDEREFTCFSVRWVNGQKLIKLVPGNLEVTLPLSACVSKNDTVIFDGNKLFVKCQNGLAQLLPSYVNSDILRVGGRDIEIVIKEITTIEEQIAYEALADYHYREATPSGRYARLIIRSYHPLHPTILGYVELQTTFFMNKARSIFFDAPFHDGDEGIVQWQRWDQVARKFSTHAIVRIARCVVHPEFRGLGLGKSLIDHASQFAIGHWQSNGLKPLFIEISADMLKYVPFAERAGMTYMGDTEGNLNRVYRDLKYLLSNVERVQKGEVARKDSIAIVREQVNRMERALLLIEEEGLTTVEFLDLVQNLSEMSALENYERLHDIVRLPKPTFLKGLTQAANDFVIQRACELALHRKTETPDWIPIPIEKPIALQDITLSYVSKVTRTAQSSAIQQAFNISPDQIISTHVRRLTLDIIPGEIYLITGPSGSGKTTLLNELINTNGTSASLHRVGNIHFPTNYNPAQFEEIISEEPLIDVFDLNDIHAALHLMGLVGLSDAYIYLKRYHELSKGQQFRVQLAKLIISGANVWIIDEFCSNLDPVTASVVSDKLQRVARQLGVTVIIAAPHVENFIFSLRPTWVLQLTSVWEHRRFLGSEYAEAVERGIARPQYLPIFDLSPEILTSILRGETRQILNALNPNQPVQSGESIILTDGERRFSVTVEATNSKKVEELTADDAAEAGYPSRSDFIAHLTAQCASSASILNFGRVSLSVFYQNATTL
jgi:ABC-type ATPase with predicted acetyltransferase domain